jgi:hypothetical protein
MQMTNLIATAGRASAKRLDADYGPGLVADVEAALRAATAGSRSDQYVDPVSLGSLIVAAATLAWTVYSELKKKGKNPSPEVVARTVRLELQDHGGPHLADREMIVNVVVDEVIRSAEDES